MLQTLRWARSGLAALLLGWTPLSAAGDIFNVDTTADSSDLLDHLQEYGPERLDVVFGP